MPKAHVIGPGKPGVAATIAKTGWQVVVSDRNATLRQQQQELGGGILIELGHCLELDVADFTPGGCCQSWCSLGFTGDSPR